MLAELMRMQKTVAVAGTHGKTTTTSMVAALLDSGGLDPTVINGGIINRYGSNARLGKSDWWVIEADESDGSFLRLDGTIAVVTNIDPEHLEHYGSFDAVKDAFVEFVENVPFYGLAVLCVDHPEVQNIIGRDPRPADRHLRLFRARRRARRQCHARCRAATEFDALILDRTASGGACTSTCRSPAVTMSRTRLPRSPSRSSSVYPMRQSLPASNVSKGSSGASRRSARPTARSSSTIMRIIRPRSARCSRPRAKARKAVSSRSMQPHRYTRLQSLMDEFQNAFNDADVVFVTPVYAAGEEPIDGVDSAALADGLRAHGHRMVRAVDSLDELCRELRDLAAQGDMVICMGAGDITKWAAVLADGICNARTNKSPRAVA